MVATCLLYVCVSMLQTLVDLLHEIIKYLSQRSKDVIPSSTKHVLSQLLLTM